MKMAKFLVSHFDAGQVKFKAGECYPLTAESRLCIVRGAAVEVEVADEPASAADEAAAADTGSAAADTPAEPAGAEAKPAKAKK